MSDVELQPGWWFGTVRAEMPDVREYHAAHLSRRVAWPRRPGVDPRPPPPRCLEWEWCLDRKWNPRKRPLTPDQRAKMRQEVREWMKCFTARVRRTRTQKAPSPPHGGSVIVWKSCAETRHYRVGERAREALVLLGRLAMAAGGVGCDQLRWSAEAYAEIRRPGRRSLGEMIRDQRPLREARQAREQSVKDLAAAMAAGDIGAIASAESDMAQARACWRAPRRRWSTPSPGPNRHSPRSVSRRGRGARCRSAR